MLGAGTATAHVGTARSRGKGSVTHPWVSPGQPICRTDFPWEKPQPLWKGPGRESWERGSSRTLGCSGPDSLSQHQPMPGSRPGGTRGILGFWMRNWLTQHQVSVPATRNTPEMSLCSPGHHLGHGTGWGNTWHNATRAGDVSQIQVPENRNIGTGASPPKMRWDR